MAPPRRERSKFEQVAEESAKRVGLPVDSGDDSTVDGGGEHPKDEPSGKPEGEETLYEGMCEGGPMNGMPGESRFPKGFLLADSRDSRAWVYDYDPTRNVFVSRKRDVLDRIRSTRAAQEPNYDVRAFDRESMRGDVGY